MELVEQAQGLPGRHSWNLPQARSSVTETSVTVHSAASRRNEIIDKNVGGEKKRTKEKE